MIFLNIFLFPIFLLPLKILYPISWIKICADISIRRDNYKFICLFYIIGIVIIFFFQLMECSAVEYNCSCGLFIFFS